MAIGANALAAAGAGSLGSLVVELSASSIELIKGMDEAREAVEHSSAAMLKAVTVMGTAVTAALAAIGVEAVVTFAKFESAMVKATASMKGLSESARKEMENTARSLAKVTTEGAEELAAGFGDLKNAGLDASSMIKALPEVTEFAEASVMELSKGTQILTQSLSALGLQTKDATENAEQLKRISDVLSRANQIGRGSAEQFGEGLMAADKAMKMAGIDLEQGVAVLAAFSEKGIKGAEAGDSLASTLKFLQTEAIKNRSAFEDLGIKIFDAHGNLKDMADVVGSLEHALRGMSVEQKRETLDLLGFNLRSLESVLVLDGMSDSIRAMEGELRKAGGTTKEIADKQLETFNAQMKITWHLVEDLLLTIGQALVPVLKVFNSVLQETLKDVDGLSEGTQAFVDNAVPALLVAFGMVGDAINGWRLLLKTSQLAFAEWNVIVAKVVTGVAGVVAKVFEVVVNDIVAEINWVTDAVNKLLPKVSNLPKIEFHVDTKKFQADLDQTVKDLVEVRGTFDKELSAMSEKDSFSDRVLAGYERAKQGIKEGNAEIEKDCSHTIGKLELAADEASKGIEETARRRGEAILMLEKLLQGVPKEALEKQGIHDKLEDPSKKLQRQQELMFGNTFGDPAVQKAKKIQDQLTAGKEVLAALHAYDDQDVNMTAEVLKKKQALYEIYNKRVKELQLEVAREAFESTSKMFESLSEIAETWGGKQSAMYQAMFAASKAFAIAEATVKIMQGIAKASSLGFPEGLAAMASVAAATATIVSSISAVTLNLTGKKAAGGPVSAGGMFLVGEKGPELFVPNEHGNIVPNDKLGGMGKTRVVINNFTDATPVVKERQEGNEKVIEVMIRRVKNEIGSEIQDGRGNVAKAMETTFGLRRGR